MSDDATLDLAQDLREIRREFCEAPDCTKHRWARGLCGTHYERLRKTGTIELLPRQPKKQDPNRPSDVMNRFWAKVDTTVDCWLWTGALDKDGYGKFHTVVPLSPRMAHRFAYEVFVGEIPPKFQVDHLCRVRACVNPEHLEAVTQIENTRRAPNANRLKTHCKKGHPFDEANTYVNPNGKRFCRRCNLVACKEYRARRRAG